jgi:hypothetical protein
MPVGLPASIAVYSLESRRRGADNFGSRWAGEFEDAQFGPLLRKKVTIRIEPMRTGLIDFD